MDRRQFLGSVAAGSAAITLAGNIGWAAEGEGKATVVLVRWPGSAPLKGAERTARVEAMVAAGLEKLTGEKGAAAWKRFVKPEDVVGLKVNCLAARRPTSLALADVAARGVLSAGVKGDNCLVFDRFGREMTSSGYTLGTAPGGYRVVATDDPAYGWDDQPTEGGKVSQRLSRIVSTHATALINLPVVKDHNIGGVTGAIKSHMGSILNPSQCHAEKGDPYFADVAALAPLKAKHRLVIGDGLTIIYDGGPDDRPDLRHELDTLLFASDPVAHDVVMWQLVEEVRAAKGLKPLARVGRKPTYLQTASEAPRSLGVADVAAISVVRVELG